MTEYELRYIKTGTVPSRGDLLLQGGDPSEVRAGPVYVFYIKTAKEVVLIDTSFHMDDAKILGVEKDVTRKLPDEDPLYALKQVGVEPEDVTHLILTHAHFDHVGYLDAFPNAKVFAHQKELAWIAGLPVWSIGYGSFSIEKIERVRAQMTVIYGERAQILPGIEVVYAGGHSAGSMAVVVNTKKGRVCLCGDNCFLYETIEEHLPIGLTNNLYESLAFMEKLPALGDILIPGHDPLFFDRFPNGVVA
jgi:glyoxylase-like metal-dependent hydrolase (beta-lactamase superfamily II)